MGFVLTATNSTAVKKPQSAAVLLDHPSTAKQARIDLEILKLNEVWEGIASKSLFNTYLKGLEPSQLLNTTVRTTCCFSKDVPGLQKCGFCPIL